MWMFLLWWCVDDHLARGAQCARLWAICRSGCRFIIALAFSTTLNVAARRTEGATRMSVRPVLITNAS